MMMPASNRHVFVVGGQQLQNTLLAEFLSKQDIPASVIRDIPDISAEQIGRYDHVLFLVDFNGDINEAIGRLLEIDPQLDTEVAMAVFNVSDEDSLAKLAGLPMVNGGFLHDCPQGLLLKGIGSMFEGELWLPRKVLQQYLVKSRAFNKTFSRNEVSLTDRELEVLKVLATGAKNSDIAKLLDLSPHTVKTHIYNIFKKINASNRLQAVNWAQENL